MYTVGLHSVLRKPWRSFVGVSKVNLVVSFSWLAFNGWNSLNLCFILTPASEALEQLERSSLIGWLLTFAWSAQHCYFMLLAS